MGIGVNGLTWGCGFPIKVQGIRSLVLTGVEAVELGGGWVGNVAWSMQNSSASSWELPVVETWDLANVFLP